MLNTFRQVIEFNHRLTVKTLQIINIMHKTWLSMGAKGNAPLPQARQKRLDDETGFVGSVTH